MVRIFIIIGLWMLFCLQAAGQHVEWAYEVEEFSSQFGYRQYSARQALERPNILPKLGLGPAAWSPKHKNKTEYIKVSFDTLMSVQQIAVAEVHNPGGITHIYAYDEEDNEYLIREFEARHLPIEGRLFRYFFDPTPYRVSAVKLVIDGAALPGHFGIDAIAVSNSNYPITVDLNLTDQVTTTNQIEVLGPEVNSIYPELRPILSPDGSTLYFSRQNHPDNYHGDRDLEDIWYSTLDSAGNWTEARNIGFPLNNKGPNFLSSIRQEGDTTFVLLGNNYYGKHKMTQGLSMSLKQDSSEWIRPMQQIIKNDYNKSDKANYFLSADGRHLIMSVERLDTEGSRDLYVSHLEGDEWSEPINLGHIINSVDEEASPYLAHDGKTLFFSSRGFSGYGGYDIYLSRRLDSTWTNWSDPENLGSPFNSEFDDLFFNYVDNDYDYAYFVRGEVENTDIVRIQLPYFLRPDLIPKPEEIIVKLYGYVTDASTGEGLEASIEINEHIPDGRTSLVSSEADSGYYEIVLKEDMIYRAEAKTEGYNPQSALVDLTGITESTNIRQDFQLEPLKKEVPIVLNNVNFDFDSHNLRDDAFPELDKLVQLMWDNPGIRIKISGHTCSMGSDAYNLDLSHRRAGSIRQYILSNEIHEDRVEYQGYGETAPIASNDREETREINRRVEFTILKDNQETIQSVQPPIRR